MNSIESPKIIISGSIAQDLIHLVPGLLADRVEFRKKHKLSLSILSEQHRKRWGGTGANIAYTLGLLGEHPILLGSIGSSSEDSHYLEELKQIGVDVSHVHRSDKETASFTVLTDMENNQIGAFGGGAMFDSDSLSVVLSSVELSQQLVIISPHDPKQMLVQVQECVTHGIAYCFDIGQQVNNSPLELLKKGVEHTQVLILNDYEMQKIADLLGVPINEIKKTVPLCITTLGSAGSVIEGSAVPNPITIPIAKVKNMVDPTGAGDAYRSGFFFGYVRDWPLEVCGRVGAVSAAYAVEQHGGQAHFFKPDEFVERYRQNFGETIHLN